MQKRLLIILGGTFDKNNVEAKLFDLEKTLQSENFWKDQAKVKKTVKQKKIYEDILNIFKNSKKEILNIKDLYNLASEEKNEDIILECNSRIGEVYKKLKKAMKMLLTGDPVSAKHAKEIGLINDHFNINSLEEEIIKLAENISSKSKKVVKIGKRAFYKQLEMPLDKAYKYTSQVMSENMMTIDAKEGISAFIEKRKPNWKDK